MELLRLRKETMNTAISHCVIFAIGFLAGVRATGWALGRRMRSLDLNTRREIAAAIREKK